MLIPHELVKGLNPIALAIEIHSECCFDYRILGFQYLLLLNAALSAWS